MTRRRIGFWYRLVVVLLKPLLVVLTKRDWRGMENIPAEGGFVTAVNHISYVDPVIYGHFQYETGRPAHFLAKASLFKIPVVGRIITGAGQIPVYRDSADAALAFRAAVEAIERGDCVTVYPEGTITRDPDLWPMNGKTGAARIALTTGAPVIPVAQWGPQDLLAPYGKRVRLFPRKRMRIIAGPPVDLDEFRGRDLTADVLRGATDRIMDAITELLAEARGVPAPERLHRPRRGGRAVGGAGTTGETGESGENGAGAANGAIPADGASPANAVGELAREARPAETAEGSVAGTVADAGRAEGGRA